MAGTKNSTYFDVFGEDSEYFDSPQLSVTPETEQTTSQTTTPQTTTTQTTNPLQRFSYLSRTPYAYGNYNTTPVPMFDHPAYDPNAGRQEAYDREYARYMSDLRNSGRRRVNLKRANQAFEQRFNESWQQGELGRRNAYLADRRRKLDEYWNSKKKEHEDAIAEAYRQEGYTFDEATGKWKKPEPTSTPDSTPASAPTIKSNDYWNQQAQRYGFADMNAVSEWQKQNGLEVDGKFGQNSLNKWNELQSAANTGNTGITEEQFRNNKHFRNHYGYNPGHTVEIDGKSYPVMVTTGLYGNNYGVENDRSYAFDPETGKIRAVKEDIMGMLRPSWAKESDWITPGWITEPQQKLKQGGLIKKHQQGGNMEQDIQAQVKQLVQAVAAGDQQAAEQVKQIMQAAEQGDQQALQIAQMIQAEIEAIKSAKRGAKLNYIKFLRGNCPEGEEVVYFKKGGEICKACQKKHDKMIAEKVKKLNPIEEFKKGRKTKKC